MPTKTSEKGKTTAKNTKKVSSFNEKATKKVVVKKRTSELTPTKASAAAIASQAQRSRKQALLEKMSSKERVEMPVRRNEEPRLIPVGVWVFFGIALMSFFITFYKFVLYPQIQDQTVVYMQENGNEQSNNDEKVFAEENKEETSSIDLSIVDEDSSSYVDLKGEDLTTSEGAILAFFSRLSNKDFSGVSDLLYGTLKTSSEVRDHFTAFRMIPFLDGIKNSKIEPENISYVSTSQSGNETYHFTLSYVLSSNNQEYIEDWSMITKHVDGTIKIVAMQCETSRCSFHPIFWPENFGLM